MRLTIRSLTLELGSMFAIAILGALFDGDSDCESVWNEHGSRTKDRLSSCLVNDGPPDVVGLQS